MEVAAAEAALLTADMAANAGQSPGIAAGRSVAPNAVL
jgi:hypothetical protein